MSKKELSDQLTDEFLFGDHIELDIKDLKNILKLHKDRNAPKISSSVVKEEAHQCHHD